MIGFVYLWYDRKRRMFCLGSHEGTEDDGYLTGTGGNRFKRAYRKRSADFKRRIIERIYEGDRRTIYDAEQRWLDMIKVEELGVRYYNLKKAATGFDSFIGRLAGLASNQEKNDEGKSLTAIKAGEASRKIKDERGKSVNCVNGGRASVLIRREKGNSIDIVIKTLPKNEEGKFIHAVAGAKRLSTLIHREKGADGKSIHGKIMGNAAHRHKNENGKSIHGLKTGAITNAVKDENNKSLAAVKGAHSRWHVARGKICMTCSLCNS